MRYFFWGTLTRTITLLVLLATVPALGILLHSSIAQYRAFRLQTQHSLMEVAGSIAREQHAIVNNTRVLLTVISQLEEVRQGHRQETAVILAGIVSKNKNLLRIRIVKPDGELITCSDRFPLPLSPHEYSHLNETIAAGGFSVSEAVFDPSGREFIFLCGIPVPGPDGAPAFVIMAHIRLGQRRTDFFQNTPGSVVRVVDRTGVLAYAYPANDNAFPGMRLPADQQERLLATAEDNGIYTTTVNGREYLVAFQRVRHSHYDPPYLTLLLSLPSDQALAGAEAALSRTVYLLAIAGLLAVCCAIVLCRVSIMRPVRDIIGAAKRLADGDRTVRSSYGDLKGDLGDLARGFNDMARVLETRETELMEATRKADAASKAKGEFLATMSHEIRTPMNAIIGMAYLALKSDLDEKQSGYVNKIHTAANTLLGVVNGILDLSKIEAGKMRLDNTAFDLDDVLVEVASLAHQLAEEKHIGCSCALDADVPRQLWGDAFRLNQLVTNLIGNAARNTHEGDITVHVSLHEHKGQKTVLKFHVIDSGPPLDEAQIAELYQSNITASTESSAIGFSLAGHLAQLMRGEIHISRAGNKNHVVAFLPFNVLESPVPHPADAAGLEGKRVLVVSGYKDGGATIRHVLERLKLTVDEAPDMRRASAQLQSAASGGAPFDLVLIDSDIPGNDPHAAVLAIKKDPAVSPAPVVVLVAGFGKTNLFPGGVPGADGILRKPVNAALANAMILALLDAGKSPVNGQNLRHSEEKHQPGDTGRFDGVRILLVEDNPINQQIAREILSDYGAAVTVAENGREALEILSASTKEEQSAFQAVLLDLQMPVMDGFEAARLIRKDPDLRAIPIIAMTAHARSDEWDNCRQAGMDDYVAKPVSVRDLFATLGKWIPVS